MKKRNVINNEAIENVAENEQNVALTSENAPASIDANDMRARDNEGNPIPAFPVSKQTKKDQSKTSVVYTVLSILLYVLAYLPILVGSVILALKTYELMPYYGLFPFIGVILAGVFGLVFMTVTLIVTRKRSKKSIRTQTVKVLITFVCLTTGFGLILTYVFPDVIAYATQNTLYCEDLYYNAEAQAEHNASLERDLIMYNFLNGNLNIYNKDGTIADHGDFSYNTLVKRDAEKVNYLNQDIQRSYNSYMENYVGRTGETKEFDSLYVEPIKQNERKYELYEFIYNYYILNDYSYNFYNTVERRAIALSVLDYVWTYSDYEDMLVEGFNNVRFKKLFQDNYDSFNQDGYLTFDDPLLLYAQMNGRMTIPIVLRLILNEGWTYTQSSFNGVGDPEYNADGNCLYQLYDPDLVNEYMASKGVAKVDGEFIANADGKYLDADGNDVFPYEGTLMDQDGNEMIVYYGFNEDGWMMFANGVTKRPLNWLVLDMLGDPMALTTLDVASLISGLGVPSTIIDQVLQALPTLVESLGGLVKDDLGEVVEAASAGGKLTIGLCFDDNGMLAINLYPMNATYGMLGYMQATWVDSNGLLMAVVNIVGLRNWMVIFGAIGSVLVIGAGVLREIAEKTRKRTEDSRARILTAKASEN